MTKRGGLGDFMKLLAHIREEPYEEQTLKEHIYNTAAYTEGILEHIGLKNTGRLVGLLHDMGKATSQFQEYLWKAAHGEKVVRGSVNHTFAGVIYILETYPQLSQSTENLKEYNLTREVVSYAIGAHHGLFDVKDLNKKDGFNHRLNVDRDEISYQEALDNYFEYICSRDEIDKLFQLSVIEIKQVLSKMRNKVSKDSKTSAGKIPIANISGKRGLLTRLILSALMEGDRRDTAEFMLNVCMENHNGNAEIWDRELKNLKWKLSEMNSRTDLSEEKIKINQVRSEISDLCEINGKLESGIYTLNLPTGSGKTLASFRYALSHAIQHQKKRIIYIIPLLSIIEQNENVLNDIVTDKDIIFSHHSNIVIEENDTKRDKHSLDNIKRDYLKETWSKEIIISTLVQLFHMLYSHQTSAIRRMQALIDSVIIIDEIQSIPPKLINLFNTAMNFLSEVCHTTIILCSATQPCLERVRVPLQYVENGHRDIVTLSEQQKSVFQRAKIMDYAYQKSLDKDEFLLLCREVVDELQTTLIICNTKREAATIYDNLKDEGYVTYLLTTSKCQQNRSDTLEDINKKLIEIQNGKSKEKMICVSTQLVEAGVDFSFAAVIRLLAGFENLAQAAGRCNRSKEYDKDCKVYFVRLKDENLGKLAYIQYAKEASWRTLEQYYKSGYTCDILSDEVIRTYYQILYCNDKMESEMDYPVKIDGQMYSLVELLGVNKDLKDRNSTTMRSLNQSFLTACKKFQVFDDSKIDVLVPYEEGKTIILDLQSDRAQRDMAYAKELLQKAKKYTVSIFKYEKDLLGEKVKMSQNGLFYYADDSVYSKERGLMIDGKNLENAGTIFG